ncbi:hypothetical protein SESBI_33268 [Sesbania bispinosa]|nr:hypothetical protein SESBI_33268 [Sesbania bispinosa]
MAAVATYGGFKDRGARQLRHGGGDDCGVAVLLLGSCAELNTTAAEFTENWR